MKPKKQKQILVSQAEYSRLKDVFRKTVSVWKTKGLLVLSTDGQVDVEASNFKLAERPLIYRGGVTHQAASSLPGKTPVAQSAEPDLDDIPILDRDPAEIARLENWSIAEAQRVKEIYLAKLRQVEYDLQVGNVVLVDDVVAHLASEHAIVRSRVLAHPSKIAARLYGRSVTEIADMLTGECHEILADISSPREIASAAGGR